LALFLKDNFLTASVVARRLRTVDVAGALGRFLVSPPGEGRLREGASRMTADLLEALDQERLGGMVKAAIATRLRGLEVAPLLGRLLQAAIREDRHIPILDAAITTAGRIVDSQEDVIRRMVRERSNWFVRTTGLDETIAERLINGIRQLSIDLAVDVDHPARLEVEDRLARLAEDLQHDPELRARVEGFKNEAISNPAVAQWIETLWEGMRTSLLEAARNPEATLAGKFGDALRQLGTTLQDDAHLNRTVNQFARRAVVGAVASYGSSIVTLVSDTIRGWDAKTITGRLEGAVGRDLQYIRINGTIVGGLVGLVIHTAEVLG
jgi:uncharacterized membrane-anchored protein YjiN (DUF445 family)